MKIKSLAAMLLSGLALSSFIYATPVLADDASNSSGQSMPSPSDNNSPGGDEATPDTATGDDDY